MNKVDYEDEDGIKRRVLIPEGMDVEHPSEGIPISLDITSLYASVPFSFVVELSNSLWNVGLVEPGDFLRKDAPDKIRAAILSAIKRDAMDIIALAKETIPDVR